MPGSPDPQVSIVIPAYNEARRLPHTLGLLREYAGASESSLEVLVVVEHSTDGTLELAREGAAEQANFHVIDNCVHRGKGYAVRKGMRQAKGAVIFYMDADLSVPLEEVGRFVAHFEANPGDDVLVGSRQHPESRIERRQSLLREAMGRTFNRILRMLSLLRFKDTQCGFKAFRREAATEIFSLQTLDGFAFDVEVLLLAQSLGYGIRELPVRWLNSPESKVHIVRDSMRMLGDAVSVRRRVGRNLRFRDLRKREGEEIAD
ncbi:MAG: dolichyl-phosphate beta-glucosyltransferase [Chthoniobacteraceae bacterium]|jgi:dolichyl-phosphate beta-glucosyltransferase